MCYLAFESIVSFFIIYRLWDEAPVSEAFIKGKRHKYVMQYSKSY